MVSKVNNFHKSMSEVRKNSKKPSGGIVEAATCMENFSGFEANGQYNDNSFSVDHNNNYYQPYPNQQSRQQQPPRKNWRSMYRTLTNIQNKSVAKIQNLEITVKFQEDKILAQQVEIDYYKSVTHSQAASIAALSVNSVNFSNLSNSLGGQAVQPPVFNDFSALPAPIHVPGLTVENQASPSQVSNAQNFYAYQNQILIF